MSEQLSIEDSIDKKANHWLSPAWHTMTPRHARVYGRYQTARTFVDFGAAFCFVAGSIFFFSPSTDFVATMLFLLGSILFAVKPTIDLVRAFHLRKIKL